MVGVKAAAVALVSLMLAAPAAAQERDFAVWLQELRAEAQQRGISQQTLDAALTNVQPIPKIIELDRRQPEFSLTFDEYLSRIVNPKRVQRGREMYDKHRVLLEEVAKKYGVQARFIVAFWGIETNFGQNTGGFDVVPALATLAFDGRRSQYFRTELFNALEIIEKAHIPADKMRGSWAGAMGQTQFMPSTFLKYAVDYDIDGRIDVWNQQGDVFASAANYLASIGWKDEETWGRPVRLPEGFDRGLLGLDGRRSLTEWAKLGVKAADGKSLPDKPIQASLVLAEKDKGPPFLVYDNFRVTMQWNRSTYFALAVGHLADAIGRR